MVVALLVIKQQTPVGRLSFRSAGSCLGRSMSFPVETLWNRRRYDQAKRSTSWLTIRLCAHRRTARIAMGEDYEVAYWTNKFGLSLDQLQQAVKMVGNGAKAVEAHLKS